MNKKAKIALMTALVLVAILMVSIAMAAKPQCKDGQDNDGDGLIDYPADPGCSSPNDRNEYNVPLDSCADTDAFNVYTLGTTSGYLSGSPYSNDDYCVDSSNVKEYYCSGDYEYNADINCGIDGYFNSTYCSGNQVYQDYTDYFCASGACDYTITPTLQEDCDSYDGYGSNYCSSGDVYRDYYNYYCTAGACDYTTTPELVEECDYGCTDGVCDGIPDSCFDTDYETTTTQGTVSGYYSEEWYSYDDYCVDSLTVKEYYCSGTQASSYDYYCPYLGGGNQTNSTWVCSNGACVEQ